MITGIYALLIGLNTLLIPISTCLSKNRAVPVYFGSLSVCLSLWMIGEYQVKTVMSPYWLVWERLTFVGPILIPLALFQIVMILTHQPQADRKWIAWVSGIPALAMLLLVPSDALIPIVNNPQAIRYGWGLKVFAVYFLGAMGGVLWQSQKGIRLHPESKPVMRTLQIGVALTVLIGSAINIGLPLSWISGLNFVGPMVTPLFLIFLWKACYLNNPKAKNILLEKSVGIWLQMMGIITVFYIPLIGMRGTGWDAKVAYGVSSIAVALFIVISPDFFKTLINWSLKLDHLPLAELLKSISRELSRITEAQTLYRTLTFQLSQRIGLERSALYIAKDAAAFKLQMYSGRRPSRVKIERVTYEHSIETYPFVTVGEKTERQARLFPIRYSGNWMGCLVIGPKKNQQKLTEDEIESIVTILNQAGPALWNAMSYQAMLGKKRELERERKFSKLITGQNNPQKIRQQILTFLTGAKWLKEVGWLTEAALSGGPLPATLREGHWLETKGEAERLTISLPITVLPGTRICWIPFVKSGHLLALGWGVINSTTKEYPFSTYLRRRISELGGEVLHSAQLVQELQLAEGYVESVLQTMRSGVVILEETGKLAYMNQEAHQLLKGKLRLNMELPDNVLPEFTQLIHQSMHTQSELSKSLKIQDTKTRLLRSVAVTAQPIELPRVGRGCMVVFTDISKIAELESDMTQMRRLASLGTMAATIAHEIRNPLTSIKTFAGMVAKKGDNQAFFDKYKHIVTPQIERIEKLADNLNQLESSTETSFRTINIRTLMRETLALLKAEEHHQTQDIQIEDGPDYFIDAIPGQLTQIILNLLLNSLEAMPDQKGTIRIQLQSEDGKLHIHLIDTGSGIPEDIKERLFDPFFTTKSAGTGLGLAIVRKLVHELNGEIQIESEIGKGTTVHLKFPLAETPVLQSA